MIVFFASTSKILKMGSFQQCLDFAEVFTNNKPREVVKIFKGRAGEINAALVGEVTKDGYRTTPRGRCIKLRILTNRAKHGKG